MLRPPVGQNALGRTADGKVLLHLRRPWRDGTRAIRFQPSELLEKLAATVPRPRANLVLYHGAFAPRGCWREHVAARLRGETNALAAPRADGGEQSDGVEGQPEVSGGLPTSATPDPLPTEGIVRGTWSIPADPAVGNRNGAILRGFGNPAPDRPVTARELESGKFLHLNRLDALPYGHAERRVVVARRRTRLRPPLARLEERRTWRHAMRNDPHRQ